MVVIAGAHRPGDRARATGSVFPRAIAGIPAAKKARATLQRGTCDTDTKLMDEDPLQILEVRADTEQRSVTITAAVTAQASRAMFIALSEQLDRRRARPTASVGEVLALREQTALVERFAPLATAGAGAVVQFTASELRACLLDLTGYTARVDEEHFQPLELRERLQVTTRITGVLWEANAAAAAAGSEPLTRAAQ
jgi:hypothetical protein